MVFQNQPPRGRLSHHNHLIHQTSPYLLQHAHNPVDWYPWGEEGLGRARAEDKPILLSIGYSACHWCHVMAHESFEDEATAKVQNAHFINIKVDREERPDLDEIYMHAVQLMTGRGGWPLNVFLTPDLRPFFGGTYFPPEERYGMIGWKTLLTRIAAHYKNNKDDLAKSQAEIFSHLKTLSAPPETVVSLGTAVPLGTAGAGLGLTPAPVEALHRDLARVFDQAYGGFGAPPKFPHALDVMMLLRAHLRTGAAEPAISGARVAPSESSAPRLTLSQSCRIAPPSALGASASLVNMAVFTLERMARGGMYDQLGGGFHRYSTDEKWLIPHFEKMLYDNALLLSAYAEAFTLTGNAYFAGICEEICAYVAREMTHAGGAFFAAQDADSEGEEGRYYVWTPEEIEVVLGAEDARVFCGFYDVTPVGNFEHGRSALWIPDAPETVSRRLGKLPDEVMTILARARPKLLAVRDKRIKPGRDSKIIAAWNGLMISGLARAGFRWNRPEWLRRARAARDFIFAKMVCRQADGLKLFRIYAEDAHGLGKSQIDGFLEDYAYLTAGLIDLFEATGDIAILTDAVALMQASDCLFGDGQTPGYFFTQKNQGDIITRTRPFTDGSTPSAQGVAVLNLLRLGHLTGNVTWLDKARAILSIYHDAMTQSPRSCPQMVIALAFQLGPTCEMVLVGDPTNPRTSDLLEVLRHRFLPNKTLAVLDPAKRDTWRQIPTFRDKADVTRPTLFICRDQVCASPITESAQLEAWYLSTRQT